MHQEKKCILQLWVGNQSYFLSVINQVKSHSKHLTCKVLRNLIVLLLCVALTLGYSSKNIWRAYNLPEQKQNKTVLNWILIRPILACSRSHPSVAFKWCPAFLPVAPRNKPLVQILGVSVYVYIRGAESPWMLSGNGSQCIVNC